MLAILLVSVGAVLGASLRVQALVFLSKFFSRKYWGVCLINILASCCLGCLTAIDFKSDLPNTSTPLYLLLGIGFLGSFSTFSSFIFELLQIILQRRWKESLMLVFTSIPLGLLASFLAFSIANGKTH